MLFLLCWFLIAHPYIPVSWVFWPLLQADMQAAADKLEVIKPEYLYYSGVPGFERELKVFRQLYAELRGLPSVVCACGLPDLETCQSAVKFYQTRVAIIKQQRALFGVFQGRLFVPLYADAERKLEHWRRCCDATNAQFGYRERRRALYLLQLEDK